METPLSESFAPAYCGHGGSSGSTSRVIIFDLWSGLEAPGLPRIQCSVDLAMGLSLCSEMFQLSGRDKWLAAEPKAQMTRTNKESTKSVAAISVISVLNVCLVFRGRLA